MSSSALGDMFVLDPATGLDALVRALVDDGYRVVGPLVRDGVIVYDDVRSGDDLPKGVTVEQSAGRWRLTIDDRPTRFSWTPGADSWKRFVFPAHQEVLRVRHVDGSFATTRPPSPDRPLALLGARDCETRALGVLDRVLIDPDHPDPRYAERRADTFVVAVTCGQPSATCWCTSMGGGPRPREGFDILLTEVTTGVHRLIAEPGSERGSALLARVGIAPATDEDHADVEAVADAATSSMPARLPGADIPTLLAGMHHPHWDEVAARCLSCANCTMVCPTCFCSTLSDTAALGADHAAGAETVRVQEWASCFQLDHSNLAGHPVRATTMSRYRQWLTHKLQTWPEQFGTLGCVGCGRCTTWCPAGIDLVEEAAVLIGAGAQGGTP
ncbi:MAG: 4Fe-4S dicluster domain-containing protein [Actinobacteria bacterium]|nr:4Fe-4S dicluster domain-containing protein [Actinomycetota bacterium]